MPYKCEKLKIPRKYDKRVKLTDDEREQIKELYGKISQRKLAKRFNVSRRLIIFIGCPEKHQRNIEVRHSNYYERERHLVYMRNHRHRKQKLYLEGKLD